MGAATGVPSGSGAVSRNRTKLDGRCASSLSGWPFGLPPWVPATQRGRAEAGAARRRTGGAPRFHVKGGSVIWPNGGKGDVTGVISHKAVSREFQADGTCTRRRQLVRVERIHSTG